MKKQQKVDTYPDAPFHDKNWQLVRYRKDKKYLPGDYVGRRCVGIS